MTDDPIIAGREAWQRLQQHQRTAWADWVQVGKALKIGKDAALVAAKVKTPFGKPYVRAFGAWLRENGLDEIKSAHRYRLLLCINSLDEIEAWRRGLDEKDRLRLNHPDAVWFAWRRDIHGTETRKYTRPYRPPSSKKARNGGYHPRAPRPDQDTIRAVVAALRSAWCNDLFVLAVAAIEAVHQIESPPADPRPSNRHRPIAKDPAPVHAVA